MLKKAFHSALSLLLVFCLLLSMSANGLVVCAADFASADKDNDNKIVYVSIGDSMTNGYGFDGYDGSSGIVNYANETYSNKFAAWLAGYTGTIVNDQVIFTGTNGTVDHRQLAMSGMRTEDVHWALELDYKNDDLIQKLWENQYDGNQWQDVSPKWYGELGFKSGDYRTWSDLVDKNYRYADGAARILRTYHSLYPGYFTSSYATDAYVTNAVNGINANPYFPEGNEVEQIGGAKFLQISTEFFQKSVEDADIISLALGNTNFGTYMLNEIMTVTMEGNTTRFPSRYDIEKVYDLANLEPMMEARLREMIDELDVVIDQYFANLAGGDEAKQEALHNIIVYCTLSYLVNYIGSIDAILTRNPDVDIIQIALMNVYAVEDAEETSTTLGDIVDVLYTPINMFIAALPTYMQATGNDLYKDATFYYAEADTVACMVEVFGDDFYKDSEGDYVEYSGFLNGTEGYTANLNSTVRDRFVEDIVRGETFDLISRFTAVDRTLTVEEIAAYDMMTPAEKAMYAATNADKAKSIALYLAFEKATILAGEGTVTMDALAALSNVGGAFAGIVGGLQTNATAYGMATYMDVVAAVVAAGSGGVLSVDAVKALIYGGDEAIYQYIADRSGGQLTAEQVKALYEAADQNAAIYGYVASLSTGYLDATAVANLYAAVNAAEGEEAKNAVIYATVANIANNPLLTADVLKSLYEAGDASAQEAAIEAYIAAIVKQQMAENETVMMVMAATGHASVEDILGCSDALHGTYCNAVQATYEQQLSSAIDTYKSLLLSAVAGVDLLWTAVNGVTSLKGVISNVESLKIAASSAMSLCYLLGVPETLSTSMVADSTLSGILCMNARCLIGTGIGGHPSEEGHDALYQAVKMSYETDYTSADKTTETLNNIKYGATHGEYNLLPGSSYYVGLGDDTAVAQSYVDLLAAELGIDYNNLATAGQSMTDLLYILDENYVPDAYTADTLGGDVEALRELYIAELSKADLITVGVGSFGITDFVSAQLQGALAQTMNEQLAEWLNNKYFGDALKQGMGQFIKLDAKFYEMDWAHYIGVEGEEELSNTLADVRANLIAEGIPASYTYDLGVALEMPLPAGSIVVTIPVAELLTTAVEAYMYACVTHLFNSREVFNCIHEISPDAQLVVVGMFNPMDDMVINVAGVSIALGEYYDSVIDAANMSSLLYAVLSPNTTFVEVPDAQSEIDILAGQFENLDELAMLLLNGEVKVSADASENGQLYIKEQILNALTITKGMLGDVNLDGRVNSDDAQLILMYEVGMIKGEDLEVAQADVNGDGRCNSDDAQLILMLEVGMIESFPAAD